MSTFVVGQRFVSEAEPELGLGRIERIESRRVVLRFPASDTLREYSSSTAPIRRVAFRVGDEVEDGRGRRFRVERVEVDRKGLFVYRGKRHRVPEAELSGHLTFSKPEERLLAGLWDRSSLFDLRRRALEHRHRILRSPARGFLGGRIELVPHQLYIAQEIASRPRPRALLADEVGLGKTIEAGLVVHRLLRSGQMTRVLVLVPESLVHQWFVEMFRRFHLSFTLVDERYCRETEVEQEANPFLLTQTAIASLAFLASDPLRREQAQEAGWDLLVVDEAHHLAWSREGASPEYALVEAIARRARGLLLLTATPEQLGAESHFARLRLLDPERYTTFDRYRKDHDRYRFVADVAGKLLDGGALTRDEERELRKLVPAKAKRLRRQLKAFMAGDEGSREPLLASLVDQHGPGRVVFRNTRKVLPQFPERKAVPACLQAPADSEEPRRTLAQEFLEECGEESVPGSYDYSKDARAIWLAELLKDLSPEKVLVICRFKERAIALQENLRRTTSTAVAVFHEDLSLLQRDRNAAWFADEREGAQALLCSEIGSEGRNFQFAHHLVLFDLPLVPELLEQRIGRLDRIGQEHTVRIHVPYLSGSAQEMAFRWYHEGLDAFEHSLVGSEEFDALASRLETILVDGLRRGLDRTAELSKLLEETARVREEVLRELQQGRDRLLDQSSFRAEEAEGLIGEIRRWDEDRELDRFLVDALDYLGVDVEEISKRTFVFRQGNELVVEPLPGLRSDEVGMTCDRDRATHQGELDLLTWDHPMVNGVLETLLGAEHGNSAVALLTSGEPGLLLETLFVLETVASPELHVARFLPPAPLRVVIDHHLSEVTKQYPVARLEKSLLDGRRESRFVDLSVLEELVPRMLETARRSVEAAARKRIDEGLSAMRERLGAELERLRSLAEVNDHVHPRDVAAAEREMSTLDERIQAARPRLDAVRLVRRGSPGSRA